METLEEAVAPFQPLAFIAASRRRDPYPALRELGAHGTTALAGFGAVVPGHAECTALLRDPRMSVDRTNSQFYADAVANGTLVPEENQAWRPFLFLDPPDHTRLRALVAKAFTRKVVRDLEPRIQQIVDELLDAAAARGGELELVEDLAYPLPVTVISDLLGVPPADRARFAAWSKELAASIDPNFGQPEPDQLARQVQAADEFRAYFGELAAERRAEPRDDLLSGLVTLQDSPDGRVTEDELITICILLLVAGHETTVGLISNGMLALLRDPEQLDLLRADLSLAGGAVEETLRYDPPVQFTGRIATAEIEIGGVTLAPGEIAMLVIAAANRDPAVFDDPGRFDIRRGETRHLSLGGGIHFCLGAPLARLEGQLALATMARRLVRPRLAAEPPYRDNAVLRGVEELRIAVDGIV